MKKVIENEISDNIELILKTPVDNFIKVIADNLSDTTFTNSKKYLFAGTIDNSSFKLLRLKRFSWFDYNTTHFTGNILAEGQTTKLTANFSLIWIYKHTLLMTVIIFIALDILLISVDRTTWENVGVFLIAELLVLGPSWFQRKLKFEEDKARYLDIIKSLFETVDLKNVR
jgi:hypothetical protein